MKYYILLLFPDKITCHCCSVLVIRGSETHFLLEFRGREELKAFNFSIQKQQEVSRHLYLGSVSAAVVNMRLFNFHCVGFGLIHKYYFWFRLDYCYIQMKKIVNVQFCVDGEKLRNINHHTIIIFKKAKPEELKYIFSVQKVKNY